MAINGFGSLVNATSISGERETPAVGMAATILCWTDRHAATVVWVSPSGKTCRVRECIARRSDSNGMSECQDYDYEENPSGRVWQFRVGKRGWRESGSRGKGTALGLGYRDEYYDYSF